MNSLSPCSLKPLATAPLSGLPLCSSLDRQDHLPERPPTPAVLRSLPPRCPQRVPAETKPHPTGASQAKSLEGSGPWGAEI